MGYWIKNYLKLIRWPNLLMTIVALWVHWYFLIYSALKYHQVAAQMNHAGIFFLGSVFACVMGAGYVINDIFDVDIDAINKGKNQTLNRQISISSAKRLYWWLNGIAFIFAIVLGLVYHQLRYWFLLPVAIGALYLYSKYLKKQALTGNLLISLLCGAVLLLPMWFEHDSLISVNTEFYTEISKRFYICFAFAFFLTLIRELIKDQEDIVGDRAWNGKTLPIVWGMRNTDLLVRILLLLCLALSLYAGMINRSNWLSFLLINGILSSSLLFGLLSPLLGFPMSYTRQSKNIKIIMALGMILLPIALKYMD
jgi:4-hydroxybenzoate polyprenyltransferase